MTSHIRWWSSGPPSFPGMKNLDSVSKSKFPQRRKELRWLGKDRCPQRSGAHILAKESLTTLRIRATRTYNFYIGNQIREKKCFFKASYLEVHKHVTCLCFVPSWLKLPSHILETVTRGEKSDIFAAAMGIYYVPLRLYRRASEIPWPDNHHS